MIHAVIPVKALSGAKSRLPSEDRSAVEALSLPRVGMQLAPTGPLHLERTRHGQGRMQAPVGVDVGKLAPRHHDLGPGDLHVVGQPHAHGPGEGGSRSPGPP